MAPPRFTVLLPTHNRADVLGCAISSVLAQTEGNFELLIVADGCTDGTRDVVAAFPDSRIRFFDLPKAPGFGYANRNVALREARGQYTAFAAHDDLLLPDHLQLLGAALDEMGTAFAYSRPLWVSTDGIIAPHAVNLELADEFTRFMERGNSIPASCVVHTRTALVAAGYWPEDVPAAGDWELWRRIIRRADTAPGYVRTPTCLHFSADWRQSRFAAMEEMRWLLHIADHATWWPPILRHPPQGEPEQRAIWRAIESGGAAWVAALRGAADTVINRIAWMAVCEYLPALAAPAAAEAQMLECASAIWDGRKPGPLHGSVDFVTPASPPQRAHVAGWALDAFHPDVPVILEILVYGKVIGTTLASQLRADLLREGIGGGRCAFAHSLDHPLTAEDIPGISVRRAADGAALPRGGL